MSTNENALVMEIKLSKAVLTDRFDISPIVFSFLGFLLYQRGIIPCSLEELRTVELKSTRKMENLGKLLTYIDSIVQEIIVYILSQQGFIRNFEFDVLLGPSSIRPRELYRLTFGGGSSDNTSVIDPKVNEKQYIDKVCKVLIRQLIQMCSNLAPPSCIASISTIHVAIRSNGESNHQYQIEDIPSSFLDLFGYRDHFCPKVRAFGHCYQINLLLPDSTSSLISLPESDSVDLSHKEECVDRCFILRKPIKVSLSLFR